MLVPDQVDAVVDAGARFVVSPGLSRDVVARCRARDVPALPGPATASELMAAVDLQLHTVRSTTLDPAPPPAAYVAVSGGIFRDCSIHDFDTVRWVTGQEVVEATPRDRTGATRCSPRPETSPRPQPCSPCRTARWHWCPTPGTTRRATTCAWNLHGSDASIAAGLDDKLPLRSVEPGVEFPTGKPYVFFMDRFAAAFRAELSAFVEVAAGARPSPCTIDDALETGWWPRPRRCRWPSTGPSASTRRRTG